MGAWVATVGRICNSTQAKPILEHSTNNYLLFNCPLSWVAMWWYPFEKMLSFFFPVTGLIKRELSLENVEAKILRHGDAVLKSLQELKKLSVSQQNHKRASLFYRFVTGLRSLHNSTLGPMVPKLMETSRYFVIICWLIITEPYTGNE